MVSAAGGSAQILGLACLAVRLWAYYIAQHCPAFDWIGPDKNELKFGKGMMDEVRFVWPLVDRVCC